MILSLSLSAPGAHAVNLFPRIKEQPFWRIRKKLRQFFFRMFGWFDLAKRNK